MTDGYDLDDAVSAGLHDVRSIPTLILLTVPAIEPARA
jgi:hypothetical protein